MKYLADKYRIYSLLLSAAEFSYAGIRSYKKVEHLNRRNYYESKTTTGIRRRRSCQFGQQLARQAQKLQEEMDKATAELEVKEYTATSGGDAVKAVVTGKMEVKFIEFKPEIVDPEDTEMLSDLVIAAVNEALRAAASDKEERMEKLSGGLNMPGMF